MLPRNWDGKPAAGLRLKSNNSMGENAAQPDPTPDVGPRSFKSFSPRVQRLLQELQRKLSPAPAAERLWERLTDEQRKRLGGDLSVAYEHFPSVAMMWAALYQVRQFQAILEAGRELGFLSESDFHWLMREISKEEPPQVDPNLPSWNAALGQLSLDGSVARTFQNLCHNTVL